MLRFKKKKKKKKIIIINYKLKTPSTLLITKIAGRQGYDRISHKDKAATLAQQS